MRHTLLDVLVRIDVLQRPLVACLQGLAEGAEGKGVLHRGPGVLYRVLGVLHRIVGVLHRVLGVLHRVLWGTAQDTRGTARGTRGTIDIGRGSCQGGGSTRIVGVLPSMVGVGRLQAPRSQQGSPCDAGGLGMVQCLESHAVEPAPRVLGAHRVPGVRRRVLGVLHRVLGIPHRVLGILHRVLGVLHDYTGY